VTGEVTPKGKRQEGEGRREKGEGRREKGEGRREKGEGRRAQPFKNRYTGVVDCSSGVAQNSSRLNHRSL
jgi:hypothetical protein